MYTRVSENDFIKAFKKWQGGQFFSNDGLKALYKYFEKYEDNTGEKIELNVIDICGKYTEYESIEQFNEIMFADAEYYGESLGDEWTIKELKEQTQVIEFEKLIFREDFADISYAFIIEDFDSFPSF